MVLEELINREEAGKILDVNPRTVPRYARKGLLEEVRSPHKTMYNSRDVKLLRKKLDIRESLDKSIKEIYALYKSGLKNHKIISNFKMNEPEDMFYALEIYKKERKGYLNKFGIGIKDQENIFLAEEVVARLKITDKHVVYDLINEGNLSPKTVEFKGKTRFFIEFNSLIDFLGSYSDQLLYRSNEASQRLNKTINEIDKIACYHEIGFKLKPTKQGNYLFSLSDISRMSVLKRPKK